MERKNSDEKGKKRKKDKKMQKKWKKGLQKEGGDGIIDEHSARGHRDIENWTVNTSKERRKRRVKEDTKLSKK